MRYKGYAVTYAGGLLKVNIDNYFLNGNYREDFEDVCFFEENKDFRRRNLYAVSSGAGCESSGDELTHIAVDMLRGFLGVDFSSANRDYFDTANSAMCSHVFEIKGGRFAVDTSILYIESDVATVFNIGEAPVFHFEKGNLRKLSGQVPETVEIKKNSLGENGEVKTEILVKKTLPHMCFLSEEHEAVPYTSEKIKLKGKGYFLLCSKSVSDVVSEETITAIFSNEKIKSCDKAARIVDAAIESNPDGNYTAEVIEFGRGIPITDTDVQTLCIWMIVAAICTAVYFVFPYLANSISEFIDNSIEMIEERIEKEEKSEELKWIPRETEKDDEPEEKPEEPDVEEQPEEIAVQEQTPIVQQARPTVQSTRPSQAQAQQKPQQTAQEQKPAETQPEAVVQTPETSALPEINEEVELPIDFN